MNNPGISSSTVTFDDDAYFSYARALVLKIATKVLISAVRNGLVHPASDGTLSIEDERKWCDLVFVVLISLEDLGRIETNPPVLPCVLFAEMPPAVDTGNKYVASDNRTALHGSLDDEIVMLAMKAAHQQN